MNHGSLAERDSCMDWFNRPLPVQAFDKPPLASERPGPDSSSNKIRCPRVAKPGEPAPGVHRHQGHCRRRPALPGTPSGRFPPDKGEPVRIVFSPWAELTGIASGSGRLQSRRPLRQPEQSFIPPRAHDADAPGVAPVNDEAPNHFRPRRALASRRLISSLASRSANPSTTACMKARSSSDFSYSAMDWTTATPRPRVVSRTGRRVAATRSRTRPGFTLRSPTVMTSPENSVFMTAPLVGPFIKSPDSTCFMTIL